MWVDLIGRHRERNGSLLDGGCRKSVGMFGVDAHRPQIQTRCRGCFDISRPHLKWFAYHEIGPCCRHIAQ
jgi:hypothetical protein